MKRLSLIKGHKENYFVLGLGVILVIIVFSIAIISFQGSTQTSVNSPSAFSSNPSLKVSVAVSPTPEPNTQPPITYNIPASQKLLAREEQRIPLLNSDTQAKNKILSLLPSGQTYGTVYSSNTINIQYVQSLDLFKVEVLTVDVQAAKIEAETWFKQQGMSQQGICDLPLGFYLSWDTSTILKQTNFIFNPLPDGC